ncbi:MAG: hypothetical protein M3433_06115 [Actinomycetota bacterium]|nr:hypothetical protein [Actinomycetota bacterium]
MAAEDEAGLALEELRRRALALLQQNIAQVESTPRRPIDPTMVRTEADQAVVNVSVAIETLTALGLVTRDERDELFTELREISSTTYAPFEGVRLRRVVPAAGVTDHPGLHLLSGELYEDGAVLRWIFVSPSPDSPAPPGTLYRPPQTFSMWDDVETAYTPQGGGWVQGHHLRGETAFVPAVPDAATRLHVAADEERYTLELPEG